MDVFPSAKSASKVVSHNLTVLKHEVVANTNCDIAIASDEPSRVAGGGMARLRAEPLPLVDTALLRLRFGSTAFTDNRWHRVVSNSNRF